MANEVVAHASAAKYESCLVEYVDRLPMQDHPLACCAEFARVIFDS